MSSLLQEQHPPPLAPLGPPAPPRQQQEHSTIAEPQPQQQIPQQSQSHQYPQSQQPIQSQYQNYYFPLERVLYKLHYRCCTFALQTTSRRGRSIAEHCVLVLAVCCFGALLLIHSTFVHKSGLRSTCLTNIPNFIPTADLIHIHLTDVSPSRVRSSPESTSSLSSSRQSTSTNYFYHNDVFRRMGLDLLFLSTTSATETTTIATESFCAAGQHDKNNDSVCSSRTTTNLNNNKSNSIVTYNEDVMLSFSREKAYVYFTPAMMEQKLHNMIDVQYVYVYKGDDQCFGDTFVQSLIYHFRGYNTVMMNWLIGTYSDQKSTADNNNNNNNIGSGEGGGYIYNHREPPIDLYSASRRHRRHRRRGQEKHNRQQWLQWTYYTLEELFLKFVVVIKTSFLFFITTKLVSFTLRETQGRMLQFTHQFKECYRNNLPVVHLITTHVEENLVFVPVMVGMVFYLINFYRGDMFLAFLVLSLVWVCESLSLVGLQTEQGITYFPLFFFLYFAAFHYYYISFPYGFSYAALTTSMCFMLHSMLFFWHRYELPAVALGHVHNPDQPQSPPPPLRQGGGYSNNVMSSWEHPPPPPPPHVTMDTDAPQQQQQQQHRGGDEYYQRRGTASNNNAPMMGRSYSFNTTTSGFLSRNSSSNGMFQRGDDDPDDASSTRYYMGGEVVISGPRTHWNYNNNSRTAAAATVEYPAPQGHEDMSTTASIDPSQQTLQQQQRPHWSQHHRQRFVNGLEPLVSSATSTDEDSDQLLQSPLSSDTSPASSPPLSNDPTGGRGIYCPRIDNYDENETSALRAILCVMNDEDASVLSSRDVSEATMHDPIIVTETIFR